jgi:hypothetical protein
MYSIKGVGPRSGPARPLKSFAKSELALLWFIRCTEVSAGKSFVGLNKAVSVEIIERMRLKRIERPLMVRPKQDH